MLVRLFKSASLFLSAFALAAVVVPASAQNLLTNGSFEQGSFTDTGSGYDRLLSVQPL